MSVRVSAALLWRFKEVAFGKDTYVKPRADS
jgi:hypothetical protein